MAVTPTRYADADEYRAAFDGTDTSTGATELINTALDAATGHIHAVTRRFFGKDATATARVFLPSRVSNLLTVGDMAEAPTSVKFDEDQDGDFETTVTDFEAWPLNAALDPEPRPYYQVHLPSWASRTAFVPGVRVEVTAKWGWPDVPPAVKRATIEVAGIVLMHSARATARYDEGFTAVIGASREARQIVQQLIQDYGLELVG